MKFEKLASSFKINNLTPFSENEIKVHGDLFPNSIRGLITGPSNCGKTNLLLNLLYEPNGLRFKNIYLYSKSLHQPKYKQLKEILSKIKEIDFFSFESCQDIIEPKMSKPYSIFIFDDCISDKQKIICDYFTLGRHRKVDCFYLSQKYTKTPKVIRDNVNFLVIFPQDLTNLKYIYDEHISSDMSFIEFQNLCRKVWNDKNHNFLFVSKDDSKNDKRYRQGFDTAIKF